MPVEDAVESKAELRARAEALVCLRAAAIDAHKATAAAQKTSAIPS